MFKFLLILIFMSQCIYAQLPSDTTQWFDFWIGKWDLSWDKGEGKKGSGINEITKTLDGKVIQENFNIISGKSKGFKGTSISVFNPRKSTWHQAWADSNGGYYNFKGEVDGDKRIFLTELLEMDDGREFIQRMVFYDIGKNKLTWDWEYSNDGGKTWKLSWRIHYERAK